MMSYRRFLRICKKPEKAIEKLLASGERPEDINLFELMPREFLLSIEHQRFMHWAYCRFPCLIPKSVLEVSTHTGVDLNYPPEEIFAPKTFESFNQSQDISIAEDATDFESGIYGRIRCAKDTFSQVERETEGNSLYSPVSLEIALGLLSEATSGKTLNQLQEFLGCLDYSEIVEKMKMPDTVKIANSLWCSDKYQLMSSFLTKASRSYAALVNSVDFQEPDGVADQINFWCNEKTQGLIPQIVSADGISPDALAILCNAIYFEGEWMYHWQRRSGKFTCMNGEVKELDDFLYHEERAYYEVKGAVAFGKLYYGDVSFIGILPDEGKTLDDINLEQLIASRTYDYDVDAYMPKLNYEYSVNSLVSALEFLGVMDIFDATKSDFRRMTEETVVAVSSIVQKCRIELDESGTKAAAVTDIEMCDIGAACDFDEPVRERKIVCLNRPFYYMIVAEKVGQVLFIGKVNEV